MLRILCLIAAYSANAEEPQIRTLLRKGASLRKGGAPGKDTIMSPRNARIPHATISPTRKFTTMQDGSAANLSPAKAARLVERVVRSLTLTNTTSLPVTVTVTFVSGRLRSRVLMESEKATFSEDMMMSERKMDSIASISTTEGFAIRDLEKMFLGKGENFESEIVGVHVKHANADENQTVKFLKNTEYVTLWHAAGLEHVTVKAKFESGYVQEIEMTDGHWHRFAHVNKHMMGAFTTTDHLVSLSFAKGFELEGTGVVEKKADSRIEEMVMKLPGMKITKKLVGSLRLIKSPYIETKVDDNATQQIEIENRSDVRMRVGVQFANTFKSAVLSPRQTQTFSAMTRDGAELLKSVTVDHGYEITEISKLRKFVTSAKIYLKQNAVATNSMVARKKHVEGDK